MGQLGSVNSPWAHSKELSSRALAPKCTRQIAHLRNHKRGHTQISCRRGGTPSDMIVINSEPVMDDFHGNARGLKKAQKEDKMDAVYTAVRGCMTWDQLVRLAQEREQGLKGRESRLAVLFLKKFSEVPGPRTAAERQVMQETLDILLECIKKNINKLRPYAAKDALVACGMLGVGGGELAGLLVVTYCNFLAEEQLNVHATAEVLHAAIVLLDFNFNDLPPVDDPTVDIPLTAILSSLRRKIKLLDPQNLTNLLVALAALPPSNFHRHLVQELEFACKDIMPDLPLEAVEAFLKIRSGSTLAQQPLAKQWCDRFDQTFLQQSAVVDKMLPSQAPVLLECLLLMQQPLNSAQRAVIGDLAVRFAWEAPRYTIAQMLSVIHSLANLAGSDPELQDSIQQLLAALHDASEGFSTLTHMQLAHTTRCLAALHDPPPPETLDDFLAVLSVKLSRMPAPGLPAIATNLAAMQRVNTTVAGRKTLWQKFSKRVSKLAKKMTAKQISLLCSSLVVGGMQLSQECCHAMAEAVLGKMEDYPEDDSVLLATVENLVSIGGDDGYISEMFFVEEDGQETQSTSQQGMTLEGMVTQAA